MSSLTDRYRAEVRRLRLDLDVLRKLHAGIQEDYRKLGAEKATLHADLNRALDALRALVGQYDTTRWPDGPSEAARAVLADLAEELT